MKQLILVLGISLFSYKAGYAKPNLVIVYQAPTNDEKVAKMTSLLNLSTEQQKKYKALLVSSEKEKEELKAKLKTVSDDEKKKLQTAYKTNYETQLSKILTTEQSAKLKTEAAKKKNK